MEFTGNKQQCVLASILAGYNSLKLQVKEAQGPTSLSGNFGAFSSVNGALPAFYTLARLRVDSELYSTSAFKAAQIDQWIEFFERELAKPLASPQQGAAEIKAGLAVLDAQLLRDTLLTGNCVTLADLYVFSNLNGVNLSGAPNVQRWYNTILNQAAVQKVVNPAPAAVAVAAPAAASPAPAAAAKPAAKPAADSDSDELNLSDSEDDEDTKKLMAEKAAATKAVQDRQAAKAAQGSAKSDIAFDIKPAEASEDKEANRAAMEDLNKRIRTVEMDGLKWMGYQIIEVGYGIMKLRIMCQIVDIKIPGGPDEVKEAIESQSWAEEVQSIDVFSFQMAA